MRDFRRRSGLSLVLAVCLVCAGLGLPQKTLACPPQAGLAAFSGGGYYAAPQAFVVQPQPLAFSGGYSQTQGLALFATAPQRFQGFRFAPAQPSRFRAFQGFSGPAAFSGGAAIQERVTVERGFLGIPRRITRERLIQQ